MSVHSNAGMANEWHFFHHSLIFLVSGILFKLVGFLACAEKSYRK